MNEVCAAGGSTLSARGVLRSPNTPLGKASAPWLAGGIFSRASSAAFGSAGGLVKADGSVGGGGPKSSRGAALTDARLALINITETTPGPHKQLREYTPGVAFFMLFPSRHAETAKPAAPKVETAAAALGGAIATDGPCAQGGMKVQAY
ncbi:hypothetical protein D3C78_1514280 [compost metagenome]